MFTAGIGQGLVRCPRGLQLLESVHHLSKDGLGDLPRLWSHRRTGHLLMQGEHLHSDPGVGHTLEALRDLLQRPVDVQLRALAKGLLAEGALVGLGGPSTLSVALFVPVGGDADLAEAVAARR